MAKGIYVYSKDTLPDSTEKLLHRICNLISPDNIIPRPPRIIRNGNIAYGVMNPDTALLANRNSLLMGKILNNSNRWDVPLSESPDGSFALFRGDTDYCEIVTDPSGSRAIWYYFDEKMIIASTSQRAIIMLLGSFEFDDRVIPWMLSTGSLGPNFSWDKRIKRAPADSSIILEKRNWTLSTKTNSIEFNEIKRPKDQHKLLLEESLLSTFKSLDFDYSKWVLPLSGGYDSRGILCLLHKTDKNFNQLKTVTWGLKSSLDVKNSDAYIAKRLANKFRVSNKYYYTDLAEGPIKVIINRFIINGEGCIDHLPAYLDGFRLWKTLFEEGIEGIIRGDIGFGRDPVSSPLTVRLQSGGCGLCSDFSNLKDYRKYGFPQQELPHNLDQKEGETLQTWRDRLYIEFRIPVILSALSDLKLSYVEIINPFLSRIILNQAKQIPDKLRSGKLLFKMIVNSLSPGIGYATSSANALTADILRQKGILDYIKDELSTKEASAILPDEFLDFILKGIKSYSQKKLNNSFSLKATLIRIIPRVIKNFIHDKFNHPEIDHNELAFRTLLIIRMNKILNEDCQNIQKFR